MGLDRIIRENRATVVCGAAIVCALACGLVARAVLAGPSGSRLVALVHDGDGQVHELPLDRDAQLTVTTSLGANTIVVEGGTVRMADADCPQRSCVRARALCAPGTQIICLPHRLWIEVVPAGEAGGQMDVSLAEDLDEGIDLQAR